MRHRVDQPRQHLAVIGDDVAIVDRHHGRIRAGDQVTDRAPDVLALAGLLRRKAQLFQPRPDRLHPRAVVPQHHMGLRQPREELARMAVLRLVRLVKPDDDPVQIGHLGELVENVGQRFAFELGIERRQDQADLAGLAEGFELVDQLIERAGPQVVKLGDVTVLVKVSHEGERPP